VRLNLLAVVPLGAGRGSWISYSAAVSYTSGGNWNTTNGQSLQYYQTFRTERMAEMGITSGAPTAPSTWTRFWAARGAYHYNDEYMVSAHMAWEIPIWKRLKTMGNLTVKNLLNLQYYTSYNTATSNLGGYTYGYPAYWLRPEFFGKKIDTNSRRAYGIAGRTVTVSMGLKF
jgi:hypothetical protein